MTTIAAAAGAAVIIVGDAPGASAAPEVVTRPASGIWIVDGHGYGHGRGMSQYGARAQAAAGRSADQIVAFYYPGAVRSRIGNPTIRVLVNDGDDPFVQLRPSAGLRVGWAGHSVVLPAIRGLQRWQVGKWGTTFRLRYLAPGGWHWWGGSLPSSVTVTDSRDILPVVWNDGSRTDYRTSLVVTRTGNTSAVVNRLPMEYYLRGVVPRESPASWPVQALRAQAVAARTYAYSRIRSPRFGFRRLDRVQVTGRDGAGAFGGRLLSATITGIDGVGKPRSVAVSGSTLRNALGVRSNYLRLRVG
jgi:Stage II sporulation protein